MNELRLTEEEIDFAVGLADQHGVIFLLDHLGLDVLGNRLNDEKKQFERLRVGLDNLSRMRNDRDDRLTDVGMAQYARILLESVSNQATETLTEASRGTGLTSGNMTSESPPDPAPWASNFEFESQEKPSV